MRNEGKLGRTSVRFVVVERLSGSPSDLSIREGIEEQRVPNEKMLSTTGSFFRPIEGGLRSGAEPNDGVASFVEGRQLTNSRYS